MEQFPKWLVYKEKSHDNPMKMDDVGENHGKSPMTKILGVRNQLVTDEPHLVEGFFEFKFLTS